MKKRASNHRSGAEKTAKADPRKSTRPRAAKPVKPTGTDLKSLQRRAIELEKAADAAERHGPSKRDIATSAAWVAPILLAVNLPTSVFAAPAVSPVSAPTAAPTSAPTTPPTTVPTASPTSV